MALTEVHVQNLLSSDAKKMTEDQQVYLLHAILEDAKQPLNSQLEQDKNIITLISSCQETLKPGGSLGPARDNVNKLIALLEQTEGGQSTLNHFKQNGVYRILYRNPRMHGQQLPQNDALNQLLRAGFTGVGISAVIVAFLWQPLLLVVLLFGLPQFLLAFYRCLSLFKWHFIRRSK